MLCCVLAGCAPARGAPPPTPQATRTGVARPSADLEVRALGPGLLLHTTWKTLPEYGRMSSNGLVVLGEREAWLIDTAWTEEATIALLEHVERAHQRRVTRLIVTHSHDDRVAGVAAALRRGVTVHALELTRDRMVAAGYPAPSVTFAKEAVVEVDGVRAEVFFPGAAHAPDNVVVYLPAWRVLAGSCMIRAVDAKALGYLGEASLSTWGDAVRAVRARFPAIERVVPGHGDVGDGALLDHTLALVAAGK